ncbi:helix-turn-helix transcriptional regulator [Myroides odoratimimus]|uniref:helix-turn-helix transcriptional regulator n=1 Tax=Myroides odoratimimus TaxID=76832 RepID=UPI0020981575|nr:WYL domain-containing protein [Myroides odoratimimus]MCO7724113.1 WYL domain-containing protein [Myroides odoratimimus]MDM1450666.1 WYL domain-containing protein [Myroides odoratimimus]
MKDLVRIYNVLDLFEHKKHCKKEDILEAVGKAEEKTISYETWNRLRKKMDIDYGFEVIYDKGDDSYSLKIHDKVDYEKLMEMIYHFRTADLLQSYVKGDKRMVDHLDFEEGLAVRNESHLDRLREAMLKKESVMIKHQGYRKNKPSETIVNPLYFKQYQNRWYLIAEVEETKEFRSFGMDRIQEVHCLEKKFKTRITEAKKAYSQIVGVNLGDKSQKLQDIVILFEPDQKPYLESLKLHHSQTVLEDTEHRYKIKITVKPNYELQQQIQKFGDLAEVVEGEWLCY